ncbi:MAG TPA: hypothetical protein VFK40_08165 [Nitrososphaeraceae archaeon]|nr:hypothetical protein [Nitrososphaeraceae archaeon]
MLSQIKNRKNLQIGKALPEDKVIFISKAGGDSEIREHHIIDSKLVMRGNQIRIYLDLIYTNVSLKFKAKSTDNAENISVKFGNHSSEDLGLNLGFGGFGASFDYLPESEAGSKVEPFHNYHSTKGSGKLPDPLEHNKEYTFKVTKQNVEGKNEVEINLYIDYNNNGKFNNVYKMRYRPTNWKVEPEEYIKNGDDKEEKEKRRAQVEKAKSSEDWTHIINGPYMNDLHRIWIRLNSKGDKEEEIGTLEVWDIEIDKLESLLD